VLHSAPSTCCTVPPLRAALSPLYVLHWEPLYVLHSAIYVLHSAVYVLRWGVLRAHSSFEVLGRHQIEVPFFVPSLDQFRLFVDCKHRFADRERDARRAPAAFLVPA